MAVRYTQEQKDEVLAFIAENFQGNKRGAKAEAARHFNISAITIGKWMEKADGGRSVGKRAKGRRSEALLDESELTEPSSRAKRGGDAAAALVEMLEIQKKITELQRRYDQLKKSL